jgi:hypothetical protein
MERAYSQELASLPVCLLEPLIRCWSLLALEWTCLPEPNWQLEPLPALQLLSRPQLLSWTCSS